MKEKISFTLNQKTLAAFENEMKRHRFYNKSKFAEFLLQQVLFNTEQRYKLMQQRLDQVRSEFRVLNEEVLALEEKLEDEKKFQEKYEQPIQCESPGLTERQF